MERNLEAIRLRALQLQEEGLAFPHAFGRAHLESQIDNWPSEWGDEIRVLIYGDFDPPAKDLEFPAVGIHVHADPVEDSVVRSARTVLRARVSIEERTFEHVLDAARRLNLLLGSWALVTWGNASIAWWSHLFHASGGGALESIEQPNLDRALAGVVALKPEVRKSVEAAMFWVREPYRDMRESHRSNVLRKYVAYWNAFECLVEALSILSPAQKLSKTEKKEAISKYIQERNGILGPEDVEHCYRSFVDPGFKGKASHALRVCFDDTASGYIHECFEMKPKHDQLYQIRNAINHGEVDAENPDELLRIESRLIRLFIIVWGIFGHLVPFPYPLGRKSK